MDSKPKRRWLRYSLRTLLVFVTLTSAGFGWFGWQLRIVHARLTFLQRPGVTYQPGKADWHPAIEIPFYRRWLGDESIMRIDVSSEKDADTARELFSEHTMV